jgi:AraC-like DNA-binding protein
MPKKIKLFQRDLEALQEVKTWLEQHPEEIPSIAQLCKLSGLNADKLKKGFRLLFGSSPYAFHVQQKISKAQLLLLETEDTVFTIAIQAGYEHVSSFSAAFKKYTGVSPLSFRKQLQSA